MDALVGAGRLHDLTSTFVPGTGWQKDKPNPTAEQVNTWAPTAFLGGHDAINRVICVETRAKRLGVYGRCERCAGKGYVFTAPAAVLKLTLWLLHPRKGCSRGVEIAEIREDELPAAYAYLAEAAQRNASRFAAVVALAPPVLTPRREQEATK